MRYQGKVGEWNDERGFGFIVPNGGGTKVFLHVSSLSERGRRPSVGSLLTYELINDERGRPQASSAGFVVTAQRESSNHSTSVFTVLGFAFVLIFGTYVAYVRFSHPNSTVLASVYKVILARDALRKHPEFQCEPGKSSCSQMNSCAEAFFHQERCGISQMDGDRDGIPCEQQWCN